MHVVIAGGHGKIALQLTRILAQRGDRVSGIIRDPDQTPDLAEAGAQSIVADLENDSVEDFASAFVGADAVVFAAGAGAGSGAARKETVDYGGAVKTLAAAAAAGVGRYVIISSMGAGDPPEDDEVFSVYLRAKARADDAVMASDLAWTVVRPGGLTDDAPTGTVTLGSDVDRGEIPRADVAAVLAAVLAQAATSGKVFEVVGGQTAIAEAVERLT